MGCVNKSSKEFKQLAAKNNVADNTLELITHKYWLQTGNETLFPTDVYIQAQLGNAHYQEDGKAVRKVWEKNYSSPREFSSRNQLEIAKREAAKFFPQSAIVYYKNAKGNFVLSVKRPVEKADYTKDDFFDEFDNVGSMRDVKKLELGIKEKQSYGIDKIQELYNRFNTDRTSKDLADRAFNIAKDLGLNITFDESLAFGTMGRYSNDNTITYKKSFFERDMINSKKAPILLHEVLHALSMYALSNQTKNWKRSEALENFRTEMNSLYQDLKNNPILKGERGIVDLHEFVAELANPVFRNKLQQIDKEAKTKKSFWSRVLDAFKNLLGLHTSNSYYQRSMNALDNALNSFDIDTYMRYNGIKKPLRDGYNAKEWEFNSMSDVEVKSEVTNYLDKQTAKEKGSRLTNIKPEYKGKLIYAQSGTGKSTIADNVTVFDSDYILGQLLGVSPETAGFFFGRLSADQKKAFGEQYRQAIRDKVAQGYTVVTANESLLPEADVVVYNSNAEQTDERVNRTDRAINNRYHAIDYHESTLSKIKELKEYDKENKKEYRELDNEHYLSDIISSNTSVLHDSSSNIYANSKQKESNSRLREEVIADFLNEFGITVHTISNYDGELPLFDALNRVINAKEPSDITDSVGYAIAFMMQGDPEMQRLVVESHLGMKGDFNKRVPVINKTLKNLHPNQHSPIAKEVIKEVGRQIATELRNNFDSDIEDVKSDKSVWKVIKNFFKKLGMSIAAWGHRGSVKKNEKLFVKDIIAALGREDYSRIKGARVKEGSNELAQRVDVETALKENPYEDNIIRKLGEHGIALAGSTSIALQGSLFRPSENPLHDIDFNAGNNSSKESLDKLLPQIFPEGTIQFSHALKKDKNGDQTVTYITLSEPFEIRKTGFDTADLYSKDGRLLGKRKHYVLELVDGVQGKMLDFFTGPTQESNHSFYNQTINGHNYLLSESNAAMAAKILWARPKDMWDYKNFKKNDFHETSAEFIRSMPAKELRDELSLIKQESADYDMLNGIEEKPKSSGKAIPQDFTFADGIKVQAPFRPNAQQVDALNEMDRFMKSDETSMTLSGYAGTGKTSLMEMIAKKGQKQYRPVQFCASTNKAAAVLNDRVSKAGFKATTLNKLFGINVEVDENSSHYNARNLVTALKDVDIAPGTTVVIDEASMINEENYNILNNIAKRLGLKIIYVGDEAQLAPINETQISKIFRNGDGKVIRLTQVERTADNAILKEATDLRNGKVLSGESSFNSKGEGVAYISPSHQDAIDEVIESYSKDLKKDPNHFRILAYTNKAVAAYNNQVRGLLGYKTPTPQVGEPMIGYAQWGYDWRSKSYRLINSESYKVTKVDKPQTVSINTQEGKTLTMVANPITMVDSTGKEDTFNYIDVKSNPQNREVAKVLANEKQILWGLWKRAVGRDAKAKVLQRINAIDEFLFINDNLEGEPNSKGIRPLLAKKVIDFGYAMTVHKSQGSTFTNVLLDDVDIVRGTRGNSTGNFESFDMVNLEEDMGADLTDTTFNDNSSEEVNFGDLNDVETSMPSEESIANPTTPQTVNVKQQLEYVGVSRATDTVTVISNNVKKEGSPLHPEKTIKEDNNRSNNKNQDNGKEEYKPTDEFKRVQEGSRKFTEKGLSPFNQGVRELDDLSRGRIGGVLERLLDSQRDDSRFSVRTTLTHENKNGKTGSFTLGEVSPKLFHDIFEVTRVYLRNGELVDLHNDYSNCKCFVTSDGLCGFAIESDGNLVSVFSLSPSTNKGFLYAIKDFVRQEGATHLDAYASSNQPLQKIYSKTLGFHTAATMDYNMEYDHDDIAKNHSNPQVVFMVDHEVVEPKHFDKDSYDAAQQYQLNQLKQTDNFQDTVKNPSFAEGETQKVSLPSYEFWNDLYDETPVDAAWKVPYLKELDAQVSTENSPEENQNIINQMNTILQATSEKEYLQEAKDSQKKIVDTNLDEYDKLNQQINNLLEGNSYLNEMGIPMSATEIRHTAELVANVISDYITELQKGEGNVKELYPTLNTDIDFSKASRRQIVEAVNINRLIERAKDIFNSKVTYRDDMDLDDQADVVFDNWDAIMYLASDVFAMNEGFGIMKDYSNGHFTTTDSSNVDYDNFNDYSNDPDAAAEEGEKDEQEHWQVESRTIDVLTSMSALVRQGLHECYVLDKEGNKVQSKWGIAERINPRETVNSILRWTQGALSLEDMIKRLSNKQQQNPWLSQLIERLSDKTGKETDFQSQFYGVFQKHFQLYSIVLLEDGKYHSIPVNSHPALTDVMTSITSQFKIGEHALFGDKGRVNGKLLGSKESTSKEFTLYKALSNLQEITKSLNNGETLDEEMTKKATDNIMGAARTLGFPVTEDILSNVVDAENIKNMTEKLGYIVRDLDNAYQAQRRGELKEYKPFAFGEKNGIGGSLRNFLTPITDKMEDTAVSAFYDSGKMYQSYVTPSFMTKLFNKFRQEGQTFEDFILDEYGSSEWFKFDAGDGDVSKGWRNEWLRLLATDTEARKVFDHKVELNFNKHNYMRNMSDAEYSLSLITEYFAESTKKDNMVPAWYRVPMQSNKPSSEFIKFYSYRGMNYKNNIVRGLHSMFLQELSRIQTVRMRNMSKSDAGFIKNFDTNGRKFNFLPVLNAYLENSAADIAKRDILRNADNTVSSDNSRFASLLQKKVTNEEALSTEEEAELSNLVDKVLHQFMENRVQSILENWEHNGILEAAKNIKDIYPSEFSDEEANAHVREQVENFLWNDSFASKNILQLTLSDIAFYKDTEDLQKRLAQLHAPGIRGRIDAIDYEGNRVSDGKYRTFILQDFDSFKSNIIANISEVFDRKIAAAPENQKAQMIALKESLVGTNGKYTKINVTDAQGYSSPSSYRKKAFIFGRWSRQAEDIYQKLAKGEYNYTDLETAFQPLKPFVYSKLSKNIGTGNSPIQNMQVPFQAKNAEYLLIMADAILKGEELSRPNLLRAVYRVMEDSEKYMPTKGIDTVQFESAIKSGLQGKMNIFQFREMVGGEEAAYTFMMNQIFKDESDATGARVYRNYNTDTFVHEASYDDYCLQQEVPEHFKEHSQAHGSQIRMITPSDLDLYTVDENGVQVDNFYEWTEPDGTHRKVKADEFRKEYEQTIADNIQDSIDNLSAELHLNSEDKKERNIALSKILQREIISSPRYGIDLIQACSIDKETGEFRIPKGDPIQAKRIEQLINSIIKNRINKQKIAGGPIVQVSNFGTSQQLHIRFNDRQGNLIPLEEEYNLAEHDNLSYKDYCKKNQGGIAYFEVFCPIWANELYDKFANADGTINMEAINKVDPELLKMVSYRIPTEDKYSCAPMKVVGFMPREAGDAIMLPYELTEIDDSDFDVDKRYVMRKDITIKTRRRSEIESELFARASESYKKSHEGKTNNQWIREQIKMFLDNPQKMKSADKLMGWLYKQYQQIAYYTAAPTSGKTYRDNKIIDMTYAVLTNPMSTDKILNPGGFDAPKKMGYMVAAYKNPANKGISWNALESMSIDELKKLSYTDKDLTFADTQVQFYKQNSAASSLIGVFAVNKVAHATLESNDIFLDVSEICGDTPFEIAGTSFGGRMQIDAKYDSEGNLIGKTLGSLVSASADAVKDPILNLMNINMTTAGMLNTMLRLGMTFNNAALFLSQNIIERTLNQFNKENLTNSTSLDSLINKWLDKYKEDNNISDTSTINTEPLTKEELIEGLTSDSHEVVDYKVLLAFQKIRSLLDAMRKPTFVTRFNSISSAVGPLIVDNLILEHKMEQFIDANCEDGTHFYTKDGVPVDIDDIFFDHPVLKQFARTVDIAKSMFSDMPTGSRGFRNLLAQLPKDISDKMYNDKKLLDQFSNFYQSYLLVQSGVVNPKHLKDYATRFPEWFIKQNFKEKYADNPLIQAIRMNVSKKTGRPYLIVNITGIDEQKKEIYRSAWTDLHKEDPELSQMLFNYSFFRAGIGFSPKTFMSLVPTYVKEKLKSKDGSASYVDTYRHFPEVIPDLVIDQFIRNNWDNNKLVPRKGGKDAHYNIDLEHNRLTVYRPEEISDLSEVTYMKTKAKGKMHLWHLVSTSSNELVFEKVSPLGNNGEYVEMSTSDIRTSLTETTELSDGVEYSPQESAAELKTDSPQEETATETSNSQVITTTEEVKNLAALADLIMKQNPKLDKASAEKLADNIKGNEKMFARFLQNVFKQKGLDLSVDEAINEFKKYC